ncbi:hypothetical protein BB559_005259 [Furculomyces boomerangus]|uniref:Cleavage and polyadenylation specificity factor subunit 5 n=2 Tax=Harpellales TaxID=61421 RepID=A0A2T9Y9P7_9FUNG|nr:hypothetical protein BB559_005259 [Furculomyces boomerangus]PVZ98876.1 hypothetical protein BB558_005093 [Smittium angustum]
MSKPTFSTIPIYPLDNYAISTKEPQPEEDISVQARLKRLEAEYETHGTRTTVEAVMIVHEHNFPHVLLLQNANSFFKLPGDSLPPQDSSDTIGGLKKILNKRLAPMRSDAPDETEFEELDWDVGEVVANWYRPNFDNYTYPYKPAHVSRPKEIKKIYLVNLPEKRKLCVPRNMKLLAVPLFELYDNNTRYGQQFSALTHNLSRFNFSIQQ